MLEELTAGLLEARQRFTGASYPLDGAEVRAHLEAIGRAAQGLSNARVVLVLACQRIEGLLSSEYRGRPPG